MASKSKSIQVLIPCYNEQLTIAQVISDFREKIPGCEIIVGDNCSEDETAQIAAKHADKVVTVFRRGKGEVMKQLFHMSSADIVIMCDGDNTYDLENLHQMITRLEITDICIGKRVASSKTSYPKLHIFGNSVFSFLSSNILKIGKIDVFSGLRVMKKEFIKSMPLTRRDFAIETEINLHAAILGSDVVQIDVLYKPRIDGSDSKLHSSKDGLAIVKYLLSLAIEFRPLVFILVPGMTSILVGLLLLIRPFDEFLFSGVILKTPSLISGMSLLVLGQLLCGMSIVLNLIRKIRIENRKIAYLQSK